jgi:uncharacterized SAM-binding protein YcdF (DUF218 family)
MRLTRWLAIAVILGPAVAWLVGLHLYVDLIRVYQTELGVGNPLAPVQRSGGREIETVPTADAVVVATGGTGRLAMGFALLRAERAPVLFISGVDPVVVRERIREVIPEGDSGLSDDVIACCVQLGYGARDTVGNAREVSDWLRYQGGRSLILVTSDYHLPRTLLEFRAVMPEIRIEPVPVVTPDVRLAEYWLYPGSFALLAGEWSKYLFAQTRITVLGALTGLLDGDREG